MEIKYICYWRASETLSGVTQSRFRYLFIIYVVHRTSFSARASNYIKRAELSVAISKVVTIGDTKNDFQGKRVLPVS